MSDKVFKLKEFNLHHSNSTMKVGTDAMILGALSTSNTPQNILDIGTGCGILALMMAQKYPESNITGIDIHAKSIEEAQNNFQNSKFSNLTAINTSLQDFAQTHPLPFDLIISNPPFFDQDLKSDKTDRNLARHNDNLSFEELLRVSSYLMHENSLFWFILPSRYHEEIQNLSLKHQLYIKKEIHLKNDDEKPIRIVHVLGKTPSPLLKTDMNIRVKNQYSEAYKELTKAFHFNVL